MAKTSKDIPLDNLPEEDRSVAALDFDASHDEDERQVDNVAGTIARRKASAQRAPNQSDAPGAEVIADELDGDRSFDEEGQPTGRDTDRIDAADTELSSRELRDLVDAEERDEQELADVEPVGRSERKALEQKIATHARDPNAFEPAEAEVQRAIQNSRGGQK